jgi:hypothetical protein
MMLILDTEILARLFERHFDDPVSAVIRLETHLKSVRLPFDLHGQLREMCFPPQRNWPNGRPSWIYYFLPNSGYGSNLAYPTDPLDANFVRTADGFCLNMGWHLRTIAEATAPRKCLNSERFAEIIRRGMNDANPTRKDQVLAASPPSDKIYMTVGETPESFRRDVLMRAFTDYSVALGRVKGNAYSPLGTGVLVQRGRRFGILTAYHCLHSCSPPVHLGSSDGDTLWLMLGRGRTVIVEPQEVVEHVLAQPRTEEFGPDLSFLEILSVERLGTFNAVGTFWSLDKDPSEIARDFGTPLTPIASIGFPEFHHNTVRDDRGIRHQIRHMVYDNAIKEGDVFQKDGWDYLDTTIWFPGSPDLPPSFKGVSGGPVWGMELRQHKSDGHISIDRHALIGVMFYEIYRKGDEGRLRAHFINSIYDHAWTSLG